MWKLTIEDDDGTTHEVELEREGYSVGRDASCDVCLPARNVSRRHARLERGDDGRWWLADLGALYGSFVNGFRVAERVAIAPGDVVQVGDHWLGFVSDEMVAEGEGAMPSSDRLSLPWGVRSEPDQFLVFGGPDDGSEVRLDEGPVLVGAGDGVTIHLPEGTASAGVHALVRPLPEGRYELVRRSDTLIMRVRSLPADRTPLDDGDVVVFEAPGEGELLALQFCAARRVRRSMLTPPAKLAERAGRGLVIGQRIDPAVFPTLEAIRDELAKLPSWWRLEGESVWPRPEGYRSAPVRFTDLRAAESIPHRSEGGREHPAPRLASAVLALVVASAGLRLVVTPASLGLVVASAAAAVLLALVVTPAGLGFVAPALLGLVVASAIVAFVVASVVVAFGFVAPALLRLVVASPGASDEAVAPSVEAAAESTRGRAPTPEDAFVLPLETRRWRRWALALVATLTLLGGAWALTREDEPTPTGVAGAGAAVLTAPGPTTKTAGAPNAVGAEAGAGAAETDNDTPAAPSSADPAASAPPSASSAARNLRLPPGTTSAKRPPADTDAARRERCKYLGLSRCD
ncbi:MAG: FHA domain-containing protein [Polyangiaceae bacterium]|nr:FHA domain-containing protein [Polyangiaceae bacterium]